MTDVLVADVQHQRDDTCIIGLSITGQQQVCGDGAVGTAGGEDGVEEQPGAV